MTDIAAPLPTGVDGKDFAQSVSMNARDLVQGDPIAGTAEFDANEILDGNLVLHTFVKILGDEQACSRFLVRPLYPAFSRENQEQKQ